MIATQNGPDPRNRPGLSAQANDTERSTAHKRRAQKAQTKPRPPKYQIPPGLGRHEHDGRGAYRWPIWPTSLTKHRTTHDRKDHQ